MQVPHHAVKGSRVEGVGVSFHLKTSRSVQHDAEEGVQSNCAFVGAVLVSGNYFISVPQVDDSADVQTHLAVHISTQSAVIVIRDAVRQRVSQSDIQRRIVLTLAGDVMAYDCTLLK